MGHKDFIPNSHSGKSQITDYLSTTKAVVFLMAYRDVQGIMAIWTEHIDQLKEGFFSRLTIGVKGKVQLEPSVTFLNCVYKSNTLKNTFTYKR